MRTLFPCMLLSGLLVSTPLVAQAAQPENDVTVEVERLAQAAFAHAQKSEYSEAIATYLKAYQLRPTATLLYNIAAIYDRRLRDTELATEYYTRFLKATDAEPELAEKAHRRLVELRATAAEEKEQSQEPAPRQPNERDTATESPSPTGSREEPDANEASGALNTAGWVLVTSGAVVAGAGFVLGGLAWRNKTTADDDECTSDGCTKAGRDLIDDGQSYALMSTIGVAAGAALAVGGIVLWGLDSTGSESAQLSLSPQPGGAAATLKGSF